MISADAITSRTFRHGSGPRKGIAPERSTTSLTKSSTAWRPATPDSLARRIKEKTFSNVRFREGDDIDEVDDFLDEVARGLEGDAGASTGASAASTASAAAAIPDPHETVAPEPGTSYTSDGESCGPFVRQRRGAAAMVTVVLASR